jgi:hypothetical protein
MNTISDNVANVNTEGFKQEKISFKPFLNEINGTVSAGKYVDFSAGNQKETGRAYDFAINGDATGGTKGIAVKSTGVDLFTSDDFCKISSINANVMGILQGEIRVVPNTFGVTTSFFKSNRRGDDTPCYCIGCCNHTVYDNVESVRLGIDLSTLYGTMEVYKKVLTYNDIDGDE